MRSAIAVGFGGATVTKDRSVVLDGEQAAQDSDFLNMITGADAEALAAKDPDHDWRINLFGPLGSAVYQRHDDAWWVLIEQGEGFA